MPTVLIAEDNTDLRNILAEMLTGQGYNVLTAFDGEDAWHVLQTNHTDLIVSDNDMPRMDGVTLCIRLAQSIEHRTVPFILMTGKPLIDIPSHAADFLVKPIPFEDLLFAISKAISSSH